MGQDTRRNPGLVAITRLCCLEKCAQDQLETRSESRNWARGREIGSPLPFRWLAKQSQVKPVLLEPIINSVIGG
jgi:hypothetical protein